MSVPVWPVVTFRSAPLLAWLKLPLSVTLTLPAPTKKASPFAFALIEPPLIVKLPVTVVRLIPSALPVGEALTEASDELAPNAPVLRLSAAPLLALLIEALEIDSVPKLEPEMLALGEEPAV